VNRWQKYRRAEDNFRRRCFAFATLLFAFFAGSVFNPSHLANASGNLPVDLALVLAVDVSYSVDETEFSLQMDGTALAFERADIHRAIARGAYQRIAIAVMQWSNEKSQVVGVPWTVIDGPAAAKKFAARLRREPRRIAQGGTATGAALRHAGALLLSAPFTTFRRVIDISSDGRSNRGVFPYIIRDQLTARKITINGLVITNDWPTLDVYFKARVIGGPYHFMIIANDYKAYGKAIHKKLLKEIAGPGLS
jgi:hypothetical protein